MAMTEMGIHVVVASGNSGQDSCETSPASATRTSAIISVGAIDQSDRVPAFSNYGSCTNVLAPGVQILSADASK
jgi:subtilisin family serine protease